MRLTQFARREKGEWPKTRAIGFKSLESTCATCFPVDGCGNRSGRNDAASNAAIT
jgi:hypothetical protein